MIRSTDVLKALRETASTDGMTQQKISDKSGVARSYICDLLNGKKDIEGLTLRKLAALFPDATLNLHGDTPIINAPRNNGNVVGVNHGSICADCVSSVMDRILASDELSSDEKIKFIKILKK